MAFSITKLGHVEVRVKDLEEARRFYVDLLGLIETERAPGRIYLRGLEERHHHSIVLKEASSPGLAHCAYRVSEPEDLDKLARLHEELNLPVVKVRRGAEKGQGEAIRVQDPMGIPVEFYHEMDETERLLQRYDQYRGASPLRTDHLNCLVPNLQVEYQYYADRLGFYLSEYAEGEDGKMAMAWLRRKQNVHDLALLQGPGPKIHHFAIYVEDMKTVFRTCEILAGVGAADKIEFGPGRHGLSNALFVYLRDPFGNRVEIYTGDYLIPDPDWKPIKWEFGDFRTLALWRTPVPESWYAGLDVESVTDGALMKEVTTASMLNKHLMARPL